MTGERNRRGGARSAQGCWSGKRAPVDAELWEKVFMAATKGADHAEDGKLRRLHTGYRRAAKSSSPTRSMRLRRVGHGDVVKTS